MESIEDTNSSAGDKSDSAGSKLEYETSLDGLKGIAILSAMAFNGHLLWMRGGFCSSR